MRCVQNECSGKRADMVWVSFVPSIVYNRIDAVDFPYASSVWYKFRALVSFNRLRPNLPYVWAVRNFSSATVRNSY
jgi:hypothetical protein